MNTIELDQATHTYRVDGRPFVGVTGEMEECGLRTESFVDDGALERGRIVHAMCAALDRQQPLVGNPFFNLHSDYSGYLAAWENAKRDLALNIQLIEHRVSDPPRGYAGTLDRTAYWKDRLAIVELKTGAINPVTRLQLVAYGNALEAGQVFERMAVQLKPDGGYRVEHYELASYINDLHDFWSVLRVAAWIRKNR